MQEINKQLLLNQYKHKSTNLLEGLKVLVVVLALFGVLSFSFMGFSLEILYLLLLLCAFFIIGFSLISGFSNIVNEINYNICTNKIHRNQFYIIKDTVADIHKLYRNENDAKPSLKIYFHNHNHQFWADEDQVINKGDEYYIVLFKKGFYGHIFSGLLINPKIIGFFECKQYFINNENWENNILDGKYL